ncbi:MAG: hypothetical protein PHT79_06685 [Syntrophomonadaceae bacterium]|nr:hypothetical protein [Syntrophomonadaceae bacterium]MDD3897961.1 hypothetical protein [Syntrophomonadaceae bacterium]MDD4549430.1 hypothetical protein [Syntrophomonadaceae bacterium]
MEFLIRHIQRTADIAGGYRVGNLVIKSQGTFLQLENGTMIPTASRHVEVNNGNQWQTLNPDDLTRVTVEGWPAYAGLDARMM